MTASDPRFGIELYEEPGDSQDVEGAPMTLVGHVWSRDAERIVTTATGAVLIVDPGGTNPAPLNSSLEATRAFLEAFRVYYAGHRPAPAPPMTRDEARARLRALQRGELPSEPEPAPPIAQPLRLATLTTHLTAIDPAAVTPGSWWSRILEQLT
ncbi:MAG: hypothetical protein JWP75_3650 [Frondihabitans sp.]|nr:hypothetical protein [Frondihabitans sp.]